MQRAYRERALATGLHDFTPEQRREVYRRLKLIVHVDKDHSIGVEGDIPLSFEYLDGTRVIDFEPDETGFGATLVFDPQKWVSVHSQSSSQDSSRFNQHLPRLC